MTLPRPSSVLVPNVMPNCVSWLSLSALCAVLTVEGHAFEVLLVDDVHDTGDGVGTVDGRSAARQHVDALDELRRDGVVVHRGRARQTGHEAAAVNQRQRAIDAEIAQIDRRDASARGQEVRIRAAQGRCAERGILEQDVPAG